MINKQNLWFLTLFCLILVLSVYYVTMPSELLLTNTKPKNNEEKPMVTIEESEILTALRVESNSQMQGEMADLRFILTNIESTIEAKNTAFDKMKELNKIRGEEEKLETQVKEQLKLKTFVKITSDQIRVVVVSSSHDEKIANNIMRVIQKNYEEKKYISVKFQR
ncbi:MAG: SpoIIIAH-like family protein [Bacilli bacterium]